LLRYSVSCSQVSSPQLIRYNFAMDSQIQSNQRTPVSLRRLASGAQFEPPASGELYQYLCPVDHKSNVAAILGLRCRQASKNAPILIIHDVGERADMYWECMKFLCDRGLSSYSYDQRGHGINADLSGHLDRFQELVSDVLQIASWLRHIHNGQSPIVVGQGYGAIVATELAAKHPQFVHAVVLAAPTLELAWMPGRFKRWIIRVLADILPRVKVPTGLHPRFSNPLHRVVGKTMATRLIRSLIGPSQLRLTFAFARELLEAMDKFGDYFRSIKKPVLILKPGEDEVARFESVDQITLSSPDKNRITTRVVANVHHNGFTEGKIPMSSILDEIISWNDMLRSQKNLQSDAGI
jgi:alpha-beta hydrolase superfamily lysophospholipase